MVGIVIVSHSRKLAEGIKELAEQMADEGLRLIAAGGLENDILGTDAVFISKAIAAADTGDGVVVLADLGSAIISTEVAIELLDCDEGCKALIADAPIVEGTISAAVQASMGSSLFEVKEAAEAARGLQKR